MAAKIAASVSAAKREDRAAEGVRLLMSQSVEDSIDAKRVAIGAEVHEVRRIVAFALPRIAIVRVMRHQDDHPSLLVGDAAGMRGRAVGAALRRAPGAKEKVDRRYL